MKNKNLSKIRKKLDSLDNKFLDLLKKRTKLVDQVLRYKARKNQIIDRKRIKVIFNTIRKKSIRKKIDVNLTKNVWKTMNNSFIKYEYKNFKKK